MHRAVVEEEEDDERRRERKREEALEVKSLRRIISAYLNYADAAKEDVKRYERCFKKLPAAHKALISHYPLKFQNLRSSISVNSYFIYNMLQAFEPPLDMSQDMDGCDLDLASNEHNSSQQNCFSTENICHPQSGEACWGQESKMMCRSLDRATTNEEVQIEGCCEPGSQQACLQNNKTTLERAENDCTNTNGNIALSHLGWFGQSHQLNVPLADVDKVRCIIRNIVRDWAEEGKKERNECYKPILDKLDSLFPNRRKDSPPTCLVPGAGLGRLALEISCLGFVSQGNEFSYYMMICSSFLLNHTQTAGEWTIYPWIHSNCNSISDSDQLRPVSVPDIHPASAGITEGFSMCGGDFVEVYSDPSQVGVWDAVVTCFFIDTAHNIIEYIEIISRILKDGGVWINLGPLLYHFADTYGEDEMSIELSLEDVKRVALHFGFQLEKSFK
ncbi:uncharacterized protein LOC126682462 isoform X2 [Mercurialis annua]|uniref:uncharacterized protein LOC126682462 isoform X2 n=1 Tax=Mercurialis annua TaxID=3986 RepID=UPI00215F8E36|nr:uncharacterized protein LOC126682462 isoform X2 [Mercurialis annua]